jgi:dTDP-glucose 4,6-dehydratase
MKILVTGGAGFIGANYIHYVLSNHSDCQVVNLDLLTYAGNLSSLKQWEGDSRYQFVHGDILDAKLVDTLMAEVDAVVHFAAESHVDRSITDPLAFVRTNVLGTGVLLDAARKHKRRFHHVSTDEVFGSLTPTESAFDESTAYDPRSPYSASKAGSDHLVRAYYHTYGLPITISNCSNNYGPYHFPEKLIPLAITRLMDGKTVPVYGAGDQVRDWLYVVDHARAIHLILTQGTIGETYCVGGENEYQNIDVVRKLIALLGRDESAIHYVADRPGHDTRYAINPTKIQTELGFKPSVTFDQGLAQTVKWYQENESWWRAILSGDYTQYYDQQYGKHE